jgi:hypothetical protein
LKIETLDQPVRREPSSADFTARTFEGSTDGSADRPSDDAARAEDRSLSWAATVTELMNLVCFG